MYTNLKNSPVYQYARQLLFRYNQADLPAMSAQISYFLILAFFPFLLFLMNVISFTPLSNRMLFANLRILLPADAALLVQTILEETMQANSETLLFLGIAGSIWATSQGMLAVIRGLNQSYDVKETRSFIRLNLIAIFATVSASFVILLSFFMIVFGRFIGSYIFGLINEKTLFYAIWPYFRYGISLVFLSITFLMLYRYLPNKKLKFRNIIVGTVFATLGWLLSSFLFSFYVNSFSNFEKIYGSLGGIFVLIIWINFSSLIILLGGELNAISNNRETEE